MKQPEDNKTLELNLAEQKRGRGRPAKPDALTPAERAKRYRDAKRKADYVAKISACLEPENKRDVTEKEASVSATEFMRLKQMYWSLEKQVALANDERDAAFKENAHLAQELSKLRGMEARANEELARRIQSQDKLNTAEAERDDAIKETAKRVEQIKALVDELDNARSAARVESDCRREAVERSIELQRKLDLKSLELIEAQNKLATLKNDQVKPPKANPLTAEIRKLKAELTHRDTKYALIIRTMNEEYETLRRLRERQGYEVPSRK